MPQVNWQRLKKRSDFQRVQKQGQAVKMPALVFLYAPASTQGNRIGFTATRRSIGNAVQRNRAKRRMRALAQSVFANATPPAGQPADGVLIARRFVLQRDFHKMRRELKEALEKKGFTFEDRE